MKRTTKKSDKATSRVASPKSEQRRPPHISPTAASLTKLLPQGGGGTVSIHSGTVQASPGRRSYQWGWSEDYFSINAPPEGRVLWFVIAFDWRLWEWRVGYGPNTSNKSIRVDFGISWEYELTADTRYFNEPWPRFMRESDRHEGYSSVSPGASGFNTAWIVPGNSVTLAADSKESSPTPLQLLLNSKVDGKLRLAYRSRSSNHIVNGDDPHQGWGFYCGADYIHYGYAVEVPRLTLPIVDVGPAYG